MTQKDLKGAGNAALIILDTETTGLDHKTERLVEVAAAKMIDGEVVDTYTTLVNPEVPIRHSSYQIHGITEEMVKDAPTIDKVLPEFLEFIDGLPFVAHNAIFDYSFINEAHKLVYNSRWTTHKIDTLDMFRSVFPEEHSHSLSSLLQRFDYDPTVTHRALDDTICLAKVYPRLRELYEQRQKWLFSQLDNIEYLTERYLRLQKAVQVMQSEMADLKELFKLHFTEGGSTVQVSTGEMLVSNTRRSYEYDNEQVWSILLESGLVEKAARLNPRALDKLITNLSVDEDVRGRLKDARLNMNESRNVNFLKPQPPVSETAEDSSKE